AKPPTPAPPIMARHAITLVLIPLERLDRLDRLDRPRMFPQPVVPNAASSSFQTKRNYGCPGTFVRSFIVVLERVSMRCVRVDAQQQPRTRSALLPNQTPARRGLVILYLPEAGKPAAGWGGVGGGGPSLRRDSSITARPPPGSLRSPPSTRGGG